MKIVFISNFFNHHQKPFSDKLFSVLGNEYCFIETEGIPDERRKLGYGMDVIPPYVLCVRDDNEKKSIAYKYIEDADILIAGSAPEEFISHSIRAGKIVFRYSERPLKDGLELLKFPVRFVKWHKKNPQNRALYLLCASAYASADYDKFGLFRKKAFKWGYFPETKKYDDVRVLVDNKDKSSILWVGRMLDWKHPDDVLHIARRLKEDNLDCKIKYIGIGEMLQDLQKQVKEQKLENFVQFLGSMKPEQVREHMESAGIYLFTSDKKEGWGAVLNEAMNSGCAVIASHEIGAVPYLMKDNQNGLIYESGNLNMLYQKVKYLLEEKEEQTRLGVAAYDTIINEWNADCAAERFIELAEGLLNNKSVENMYETGPCSIAEKLSDKWNK